MRRNLLLLSLIFILGCKTLPPPIVVTENKGGEKLVVQEIQKTADRKEVPVDLPAKEVVSIATFSHAGGQIAKVLITKSKWNPFSKPKVYSNCINCHVKSAQEMGLKVEQPKNPWWYGIVITLSVLLILGIIAIYIVSRLEKISPLNILLNIFKRN